MNWNILDLDNQGVFYTDANAYKFVKRNVSSPNSSSKGAYFFPVNSGIFIESSLSNTSQVGIMNDRPMAASAYSKGRIEFIIMRQSVGMDGVGINEPMIDWSPDGKGINYTATFHLAMTTTKEELYKLV